MTSQLLHQVEVSVARGPRWCRRDFLRTVAAAGAAGSLAWTDVLQLHASQLRRRGMACILLWMQGGPSQFETFSPLPGHPNGGETKAIPTNVPGIHYSENLSHLAEVADKLCVFRSMTGKEGSHPRATYLMHTGYLPTASIKHPSLGANIAHQLGSLQSELPDFVRIGSRGDSGAGAGFLGVDYDAFVVADPNRIPDNTALTTSVERFRRRLKLAEQLGLSSPDEGMQAVAADQQKLHDRAARLVLSPKTEVFDLDQEPDAVRQAYGSGAFASACLLARRLVESGVTFVEVTLNGWDTHEDNFARSRALCQRLDQPCAQLIRDLDQRGLLDRTLVVWMGEFGRTPRINPRAGRDHFPRAFSVALAGAGIRGGQVIGATDAGGLEVTDRPVLVEDLFCTIFQALQLDPRLENLSPIGRPIKLIEGGSTVQEALL